MHTLIRLLLVDPDQTAQGQEPSDQGLYCFPCLHEITNSPSDYAKWKFPNLTIEDFITVQKW